MFRISFKNIKDTCLRHLNQIRKFFPSHVEGENHSIVSNRTDFVDTILPNSVSSRPTSYNTHSPSSPQNINTSLDTNLMQPFTDSDVNSDHEIMAPANSELEVGGDDANKDLDSVETISDLCTEPERHTNVDGTSSSLQTDQTAQQAVSVGAAEGRSLRQRKNVNYKEFF